MAAPTKVNLRRLRRRPGAGHNESPTIGSFSGSCKDRPVGNAFLLSSSSKLHLTRHVSTYDVLDAPANESPCLR